MMKGLPVLLRGGAAMKPRRFHRGAALRTPAELAAWLRGDDSGRLDAGGWVYIAAGARPKPAVVVLNVPVGIAFEWLSRGQLVRAVPALCLTIPGCTSLSLKGERVRLTTTAGDVTECRAVGDVQANPPFVSPGDWKNMLKNQAAELGGDVVLHQSPGVGSVTGKAYDCGGRYAKQ